MVAVEVFGLYLRAIPRYRKDKRIIIDERAEETRRGARGSSTGVTRVTSYYYVHIMYLTYILSFCLVSYERFDGGYMDFGTECNVCSNGSSERR